MAISQKPGVWGQKSKVRSQRPSKIGGLKVEISGQKLKGLRCQKD